MENAKSLINLSLAVEEIDLPNASSDCFHNSTLTPQITQSMNSSPFTDINAE